jgi:hypothetical protein
VGRIPIELYEVILCGDGRKNPDQAGVNLEISLVSNVVLV